MEEQAAFYGLVLLGMAAFGTLEQLLLCPRAERGRDVPPGKAHSSRDGSKRSWRSR
jgi:hypothetical protein